MIDAAHEGKLDVLYQIGGNFLETLPEPDYVRKAVEQIPLRVHQDIVLSPQMMVEPAEAVVLLPAQTRYEQSGGGTETSTERRILFSPEIAGRRIGESLPEWQIPMMLAEQARPDLALLIHFDDAQAIRNEIAFAVPAYEGIQHLRRAGDQVQWGGARLCETQSGNGRAVVNVHADLDHLDLLLQGLDVVVRDPDLRLGERLSALRILSEDTHRDHPRGGSEHAADARGDRRLGRRVAQESQGGAHRETHEENQREGRSVGLVQPLPLRFGPLDVARALGAEDLEPHEIGLDLFGRVREVAQVLRDLAINVL